jgi:type IV secretion system protein VirB10
MTDTDHSNKAENKVAPETLELRARPQPVTRINRRIVFGGVAVVLLFVASLVLIALQPPKLNVDTPRELINVEHKRITDGLQRLPATYDSLPVDPRDEPPNSPAVVPQLRKASSDLADEGEQIERTRLARMVGQARESPVFFRLQLKAPRDGAANTEPSNQSRSTTATRQWARPLAPSDLAGTSTDVTEGRRKLMFLRSEPEKDIYNPHALQTPASPYQLMAGTVIAASLVSGLNSDLPGFVIAQVTENVYDTVSGRFLLIPQGARLIGKYDNVVAFGQERALVVWQRIILPDGSSVVIDNLPATDTGGYSGLADQVDLHTWQLLNGVALATVLGAGSELVYGSSDNDLVRALQLSTQSTSNRAGQRLIERNLNVQPTITVRPGWPLRVIVHKDIILRPYQGATTLTAN